MTGRGRPDRARRSPRERVSVARRSVAERGSVAVEYALAMAVLMIPVAVIGLSLPGWVDRQNLARTAAREGARAAIVAPSGADRRARAEEVVAQVARGNHVPPDQLRVTHYAGTGAPGTVVEVEVAITASDLTFGTFSARGGTLTARHVVAVDVYKSR